MGRKGWIIAAVAAVLIVGSVVALMMLTGQGEYRNVQGPIGIIKGPVPQNGFLGIGFTSDAVGPATVSHVVAGSGAAQAGVEVGDVIIAAKDVKDPNSTQVQRLTTSTKPGETFAMRIRRGAEEKDVSVRLISITEMLQLSAAERKATQTTAPTSRASDTD
jgi:S1-C subfamily serine protease